MGLVLMSPLVPGAVELWKAGRGGGPGGRLNVLRMCVECGCAFPRWGSPKPRSAWAPWVRPAPTHPSASPMGLHCKGVPGF